MCIFWCTLSIQVKEKNRSVIITSNSVMLCWSILQFFFEIFFGIVIWNLASLEIKPALFGPCFKKNECIIISSINISSDLCYPEENWTVRKKVLLQDLLPEIVTFKWYQCVVEEASAWQRSTQQILVESYLNIGLTSENSLFCFGRSCSFCSRPSVFHGTGKDPILQCWVIPCNNVFWFLSCAIEKLQWLALLTDKATNQGCIPVHSYTRVTPI